MTFEYTDAWLLEAIKFSENDEQGATLTAIIQAADYINHAILTYKEFASGTEKLKSIGLVREKNKRLQTTETFNEWWIKKYGEGKKLAVLKVMEEIETYLNETFGTIDVHPTEQESELTIEEFKKATTDYLKRAQGIMGNTM